MGGTKVGDPRFYARSGPFDLASVVRAAGGTTTASSLMLKGVAPLDTAEPDEVSFLHDRRYAEALRNTRAGAVVVHPDMAAQVPTNTAAILAPTTYESWARVAGLFHPAPLFSPGIHPTAWISPEASIDATAEVGPFAAIGPGSNVGPRCRIGAYASVGQGVEIGEDTRIGAHVTLSHAVIGARVFLHPGVRVGQEGFSFAPTKTGYLTIPQLGRVLIEDDVEIGANSTVDRGSFQNTVIGAGTRIDNLVQIGHNVQVGRCCVIVAQVGVSGSTVLEDFVQVGGQAAFTGHIRVGKGAQIGAQAGVIGNVAAGATMLGSPALPRNEFLRGVAILKRLARSRH